MLISHKESGAIYTPPKASMDIPGLIRLMKLVANCNLYFGAINIVLFLTIPHADSDILTTGILSVCTYFLVKMKIRFINNSKSWIEISVTSVCGLYLPSFVLAITLVVFITKAMAG